MSKYIRSDERRRAWNKRVRRNKMKMFFDKWENIILLTLAIILATIFMAVFKGPIL